MPVRKNNKNKRKFARAPASPRENSSEMQAEVFIPSETIGMELQLVSNISMYIHTGNGQHQGAREYQEDSFGYTNITDVKLLTNKGMFAILSDGMGGLENGKVVADYVVRAMIGMFENMDPRREIGDQLLYFAERVNDNICKQFSKNGVSRAGATLVCAYIFKNRIYWITLGDSRLYCLRNGHLLQMNEDHDYKNHLLREYLDGRGATLQQIESDPQKDNLMSFIGKKGFPYVDVSIRGYRIKPGDTFVLCSDGIYNGISEDSMKRILMNNNAQTASDRIVSNVVQSRFPGQDNMTIMVIKCEKQ